MDQILISIVVALILSLGGVPIVLALLRSKAWSDLMLAPGLGLAVAILLGIIASLVLGLPLRVAGPWILLGEALVGGIVLFKYERQAARTLALFLALFVACSAVTLFPPMAKYGSNWLGFSHVDASREMQRADDLEAHPLRSGASWLQWDSYRFLQIGSDVYLGEVGSLFRARQPVVIMPSLAALLFALAAAAGALTLRGSRSKIVSFGIALAVMFSSMTLYGFINGKVDQAVGLVLTCLLLAILDRVLSYKVSGIRAGILIALLLSALWESYAEFIPFLAVTTIIYVAIMAISRDSRWRQLARVAVPTMLGLIVFMNVFLVHAVYEIAFFLFAAKGSLGGSLGQRAWFIPSAFPNYWGIIAPDQSPQDPWMSAFILLGMLMSALCILAAAYGARRGSLPAIMTILMFLASIAFFARRADYALYKMAQFSQPFALATVIGVTGVLARKGGAPAWARRGAPMVAALLLVGLGSSAVMRYVYRSEDRVSDTYDSYVMARHIPPTHLVTRLGQFANAAGNSAFLTDADSEVLSNYEALSIAPVQLTTLSWPWQFDPSYAFPEKAVFRFSNRGGTDVTADSFFAYRPLPSPTRSKAKLICTSGVNSILNRTSPVCPVLTPGLVPYAKLKNYLVFINSKLSMTGDPTLPSTRLYPTQYDFFSRVTHVQGESLAPVGRYLLFRVINPGTDLRLIIALTRSSTPKSSSLLPQRLVAIGSNVGTFSAVGRGSARLISTVIKPKVINGEAYIGIDFGEPPMHWPPEPRTGLMRLYGRDIGRDPSAQEALVRNISAVSWPTYVPLAPESAIFPLALANKGLIYSGMYEDGWVARESSWWLRQKGAKAIVSISGLLPGIPGLLGGSKVSVTIDGHLTVQRWVKDGRFFLSGPSRVGPGVHHIVIRFSRLVHLPKKDGRLVSARLYRVSFE